MKPLTLGAGQLWVHMFRWKKWVLMIYEKNHIWTAEMKWKWRNDRRSERNLCKCVKKSEKKIQDFNGVWTRWSPGSRSFSFLHFYSLLVLFFTTFLYVIARSRVRTPLRSWIFSGFFTQLHKLRSLRRSFLHFHFISAVYVWFISYIIDTEFSLLYKSLVWPILEFAAPVWCPFLIKDIVSLKKS